MKIKTRRMSYEKVMALPRPAHRNPIKPNYFLQTLIQVLSLPTFWQTRFSYTKHGMDRLDPKEPVLILMNHSSFTDMKIASAIFYPKKYSIVTTTDAFVGMEWLVRLVGCIPTQKFVNDVTLIRDMEYMLKEKKTSVLMYPEASYSFDGKATALPRKMGVLLKKFDVPVIMIESFGAFSRNPLYNELQIRKGVRLSAKARCLFTREQIREKTVKELSDELDAAFGFDHFKWQEQQGIEINEPFRADGLNRILYKCAHCGAESRMVGKGIHLTCGACGKQYELTPLGKLAAADGNTEFPHIPDWYRWEREQVKQEILDGTYRMEADVKIGMMVDFKSIYMVGEGRLVHDLEGFHLTGCDGRLNYEQKPLNCYGLYADYYWYEIADVICIGNNDHLYYCFPQGCDIVAKTRMATEEMYKLYKARKILAKTL